MKDHSRAIESDDSIRRTSSSDRRLPGSWLREEETEEVEEEEEEENA